MGDPHHHHQAIDALTREVARLSDVVDRQTEMLGKQALAIEMLAASLTDRSTQDEAVASERRDEPDWAGIERSAERLGISTKTLRRALKAGAAELPGGPRNKSPGAKRNYWVFDLRTIAAWWERWEQHRRPAKSRRTGQRKGRSPKRSTRSTSKRDGGKNWAEIARQAQK